MDQDRTAPGHQRRRPGLSQVLSRLVSVQPDKDVHARKLTRGLVGATVYAVAYGVYEYFVVYEFLMWKVLDETINWAIMITGLAIVILTTTRANVELCVLSLLYVFLLEDLVYWLCQWGATTVYPFPAPDWFDGFFASFRVLGGIGKAIPFWPHVPFFYIPGYGSLLVYFLASWRSARAGRAVACVIGPFFVAIVAGTLVTEAVATILLVSIPSAFGTLVVIAIAANR